MVECQKCGCTETRKTQYVEGGYIVETSYTCKECGNYIGTMSYGSWYENEEFVGVDAAS